MILKKLIKTTQLSGFFYLIVNVHYLLLSCFHKLLKVNWLNLTMIIPWQTLEPDTLTNLIEYFVLREGTDYGEQEKSLADKVNDVKLHLMDGSAAIFWSELYETIDIKYIK